MGQMPNGSGQRQHRAVHYPGHRHHVDLLPQVSDPEKSDGVVGHTLHQAHGCNGTIAVPHHDVDQYQFDAREDSESQRDAEYLLPPAILENPAKQHQKNDEAALHESHAAIKRQDGRDHPVRTAFLAGERAHYRNYQQQPASPPEYGRSQGLNPAILFEKVVQNFVHHRDRQQNADGISGPVCVEIVFVEVPVGDEEESRFDELKDDVGKEARENPLHLALDHEGQKGDLQRRTRDPAHVS